MYSFRKDNVSKGNKLSCSRHTRVIRKFLGARLRANCPTLPGKQFLRPIVNRETWDVACEHGLKLPVETGEATLRESYTV